MAKGFYRRDEGKDPATERHPGLSRWIQCGHYGPPERQAGVREGDVMMKQSWK